MGLSTSEKKYKRTSKADGSERMIDEQELRRKLEGCYIDLEIALQNLNEGTADRLENDFAFYELTDCNSSPN